MKKKWSPRLGFTGKIIDEHGVRSLSDAVLLEGWETWAKKEDAPFEAIPDTASRAWSLPTLYAVYSYIAL